jgi:subtilisin family serine protease
VGRCTPRGVIVAALVAATMLSGCATAAHPGGYRDSLFVIMKTQADLSDLTFIADVDTRRTEVYHRLVTTANRTQAALRRDLASLYLAYTPYYLVNGLALKGDAAIRDWLSRRPEVDRVLLNPGDATVPAPVSAPVERVPVDGRPQPNLTAIGTEKVWATGVTGPGITIGIADSGVDGTHPALRGAWRAGDDAWFDPWTGTRLPTDRTGHGTQLLGVAVGSNGIGVAPGARWIGCVEPPGNLGSYPASYLSCLQFMLAPFPSGGDPLRNGQPARAANILVGSWPCAQLENCDPAVLQPTVRALSQAGMFLVSPTTTPVLRCGGTFATPPARYPGVLTVGSADRTGSAAPLAGSSRLDLVAPGADVVSALAGGGYGAVSGAAVAAAEVAGVVALLWAVNPTLVGDFVRTRALLMDTATPIPGGSACGGRTGGTARLVNADAAARAARLN